jgi:uncharacterized membrane protein
MVRITGDIAIGSILDFARRVAESIPYRRQTAVLVDSAFDLVAGMKSAVPL